MQSLLVRNCMMVDPHLYSVCDRLACIGQGKHVDALHAKKSWFSVCTVHLRASSRSSQLQPNHQEVCSFVVSDDNFESLLSWAEQTARRRGVQPPHLSANTSLAPQLKFLTRAMSRTASPSPS